MFRNLDCRKTDAFIPRICAFLLVLAAFFMYLNMACRLPSTAENVPDEMVRRQIPMFFAQSGRMPTGFEIELNRANTYGFSYASYPPLPALLAVVPVAVANAFLGTDRAAIIACRLPCVLAGTVAVLYLIVLGIRLFHRMDGAVLLALFVGFMPQVIFLNGYYNADAISLTSVIVILYYLLCGHTDSWKVNTCVKLAIALSCCVLSYYNAYGWCLGAVLFFIASVASNHSLTKKEKRLLIGKRALLVGSMVFSLTGWYFVRNALLYNGDFLAIQIRSKIAAETAAAGYAVHACSPYSASGKDIWDMLTVGGWLDLTCKSTVGLFGSMDVLLPDWMYRCYYLLLSIGAVVGLWQWLRRKADRLYAALLVFGCICVVLLSLIYSYYIDYQPQGRYVISALPAVGILVVTGYEAIEKKLGGLNEKFPGMVQKAVSTVWIGLLLCIYSSVFPNHVFTATRLACTFIPDSSSVLLTCTPAETLAPESVSFAIWNTKTEAPVWYAAEPDGAGGWQVNYPVPVTPDERKYMVHIYGTLHEKQKCLIKQNLWFQNGAVTVQTAID